MGQARQLRFLDLFQLFGYLIGYHLFLATANTATKFVHYHPMCVTGGELPLTSTDILTQSLSVLILGRPGRE